MADVNYSKVMYVFDEERLAGDFFNSLVKRLINHAFGTLDAYTEDGTIDVAKFLTNFDKTWNYEVEWLKDSAMRAVLSTLLNEGFHVTEDDMSWYFDCSEEQMASWVK